MDLSNILNVNFLMAGARVGAFMAVANFIWTLILPTITDQLNISDNTLGNVVNISASQPVGSSIYAFLIGALAYTIASIAGMTLA